MINKFQQGGKQDAVMQFVLGLALTLLADPLQVILIAQQNPQALEAAILTYQQTKDIKLAAQTFQQAVQLQTRAARHGAKLNYIKSLKNQCAEDEEVVYYKKGGSVGCGCKKKEDGGEIKKAEQGAVAKFKSTRKMQQAGKLPPYKKTTPDKNGEYTDNRGNIVLSKKGIAEREAQLKNNKNEEGKADPNKKKESVKKLEGSKPKLQKKGGEVCPKCGKVHSAGVGCAVAKFKKAYKLGGSLNSIPFYLGGTNKRGINNKKPKSVSSTLLRGGENINLEIITYPASYYSTGQLATPALTDTIYTDLKTGQKAFNPSARYNINNLLNLKLFDKLKRNFLFMLFMNKNKL